MTHNQRIAWGKTTQESILLDPNARWTTYDAVKNGLPLLEDVPGTIQERAWISPIWYLPKK